MRRDVDAEDFIASFAQFAGPDSAAAARVHYPPAENAVLPQQAQQSRRGLLDETSEARVVNVSQIAVVRRHESLARKFPIDLGGQDEIVLRQAVDFVRVRLHIHPPPGEQQVRMVSLGFRDRARAIYECQGSLEVREDERSDEVMLVYHCPIR